MIATKCKFNSLTSFSSRLAPCDPPFERTRTSTTSATMSNTSCTIRTRKFMTNRLLQRRQFVSVRARDETRKRAPEGRRRKRGEDEGEAGRSSAALTRRRRRDEGCERVRILTVIFPRCRSSMCSTRVARTCPRCVKISTTLARLGFFDPNNHTRHRMRNDEGQPRVLRLTDARF